MNRMGRPPIRVDWEKFEFACRLLATMAEICGLLKISEAALQRKIKEKYGDTFEGTLKRLSGEAKVSLRRKQMQVAMEGNVSMLIWLGKNILDQKDAPMVDTSTHYHFTTVAQAIKHANSNGAGEAANTPGPRKLAK